MGSAFYILTITDCFSDDHTDSTRTSYFASQAAALRAFEKEEKRLLHLKDEMYHMRPAWRYLQTYESQYSLQEDSITLKLHEVEFSDDVTGDDLGKVNFIREVFLVSTFGDEYHCTNCGWESDFNCDIDCDCGCHL